MRTLKNQILISSPGLTDSFFSKSVIYICEHSENGAMGLIINKKLGENKLYKILLDPFKENISAELLNNKIFFGGPVLLENGIVLHDSSYKSNQSISISESISITSNQKTLEYLLNKNDTPFKIMLGHSGWSKGQLETEIEEGDWLLQDTITDFVFNVPPEKMWEQALAYLGLDPMILFDVVGKA